MPRKNLRLGAPGPLIDTSSGLAVTHNGVTRSLPASQLSVLPANSLPWLRGVIGFAPWPEGVKVDVRYNGGTKEYSARLEAEPVASGFYDTPSLHQAGSAWLAKVPASPSLAAYFDGSNVAQGTEAQALDYWRYIINKTGNVGMFAAARRWSIPIYFSDESTPTQDITGMIYGTASQDRFNDLPVPSGALPDPAGDGHYCCIRLRSDNGAGHGEEFDGYSLTATGGVFNSGAWCCIDSVRRGYIRGASGGINAGLGCRANNTSLLGGVIWPHEIAMGRIEHALAFSHPKQRAHYYSQGDNPFSPANGAVTTPSTPAGNNTRSGYPGTTVYSVTNDPEGLPGGARVQLDPSIDLDAAATTFGWPAYQKIIAKAAQEYGMVMVDGGGYSSERIGLYLVNSQGYGATNPFTAIHTDLDGDDVPSMRWANDLRNSFRILNVGTQQPRAYGNPYSVPNDGSNATAYTA